MSGIATELSCTVEVSGVKKDEMAKVHGFINSHLMEINTLEVLFSSESVECGLLNVTVKITGKEREKPGSCVDLFVVYHALSVSLFRGRRGANSRYTKKVIRPCMCEITTENMYGFKAIKLTGVKVVVNDR